jgi:hypothetical protein
MHFVAVFDEHEGRNSADVELLRHRPVLIDVDVAHAETFALQLGHNRLHLPTGATP